jgi:GR25 family glycosyltransferase involved in LPS biosynthesis
MNLLQLPSRTVGMVYRLALRTRRLLGRQRCGAFGSALNRDGPAIEKVYVINLDRQPSRWRRMLDELDSVLDSSGSPLSYRTTRVSAVDAREHHDYPRRGLVEPTYSLGDQLFVDPHPLALPDRLDLGERIEMSPQEIAVACSHVDVWRRIASGRHAYAMVLEDDIWFHPSFARVVDRAWSELRAARSDELLLDVLYVSYREVDYGAEKVWVSPTLFSPFRVLWYLSGYVLSKGGAEKLLRSLPIRGPVDLWMNHQFGRLNVYGTVKAVVEQRLDEKSNNSYSVLPVLSRIGVLNSETPGLFLGRPVLRPVFAFGVPQSGLSSLAMALSMLGYRCCSDVDRLPQAEMQRLLRRDPDRMFDAYVNIADLRNHVEQLAGLYPDGRLILTVDGPEAPGDLEPRLVSAIGDSLDEAHKISVAQSDGGIGAWQTRALVLPFRSPRIWKLLCEFLSCVPPASPYPYREDLGHRLLQVSADDAVAEQLPHSRNLQFDDSPWVVAPGISSRGVPSVTGAEAAGGQDTDPLVFFDDFRRPELALWQLRDDTFPGNLALFRPSNFVSSDRGPAQMILRKEDLGVRIYSSAAISSRAKFLYGRFEAVLRPPRVPGVVTGLFLHRDSPRQEIDIELVGKRPRQMLTNVYYNPGGDGARFDFGYRGTPVLIDLGFDATEEFHSYAIEWLPNQLRWYVDGGCLVHRRANWAPTPIPQLPMRFHLNLWPSRSRELAGRLRDRHLPAACAVMSVRLRSRSVVDSVGQVTSTFPESVAGV